MSKNVIICCDGTTNEIAGDMTNVLRLYRCLDRRDDQICFYDCGVGTVANPDRMTQHGRQISRMVDSALGLSVRANALDAYRFLVQNYQPGDKIYLFGFSRGAYTVRAVAGMLHFLGLLRPELANLQELAWSVYSGENASQSVQLRFQGGNRFRKSFCIHDPVPIHFVGVWDTVSSFGWLGDLRTLPHTANNPSLLHVRHAVAIDERRAMFQANHFRPEKLKEDQSYKEVWFAGSHCDVGGGYEEKDGTVSKVPLEWMLTEATAQGLLLDQANKGHLLNSRPDHPPADPLGTVHESLAGMWHIAELLPMRKYRGDAGEKRWQPPHFWKRRTMQTFVPGCTRPTIHSSVVQRISQKPDYKPSNLPAEYDIEP